MADLSAPSGATDFGAALPLPAGAEGTRPPAASDIGACRAGSGTRYTFGVLSREERGEGT